MQIVQKMIPSRALELKRPHTKSIDLTMVALIYQKTILSIWVLSLASGNLRLSKDSFSKK